MPQQFGDEVRDFSTSPCRLDLAAHNKMPGRFWLHSLALFEVPWVPTHGQRGHSKTLTPRESSEGPTEPHPWGKLTISVDALDKSSITFLVVLCGPRILWGGRGGSGEFLACSDGIRRPISSGCLHDSDTPKGSRKWTPPRRPMRSNGSQHCKNKLSGTINKI